MKKKFEDAVEFAKKFKQELKQDVKRAEEILDTPMEF